MVQKGEKRGGEGEESISLSHTHNRSISSTIKHKHQLSKSNYKTNNPHFDSQIKQYYNQHTERESYSGKCTYLPLDQSLRLASQYHFLPLT